MLPTTATIVDITLGGKPEKLYFGFRAWKLLGVNPLKSIEVIEFLQSLNPDKAAEWIMAGLAGYRKLYARLAEPGDPDLPAETWDLDAVIDVLDTEAFGVIAEALGAASGKKPEAEPEPGNA